MKKTLKILFLGCTCLFLAALLCSCGIVEDLKQRRVYTVDEDYEVLEYQGIQYKKLKNNNRELCFEESLHCYAAESDLPLLLIQDFGTSAYYDETRDMIRFRGQYYTVDKNYEKYSDVLKNGVLDHYRCYEYIVDEEKKQIDSRSYVLSEDATRIIKETAYDTVGRQIDPDMQGNWEYLEIDACDGENLLVDRGAVQLYHDYINDSYGILVESGDGICIVKEFQKGDFGVIREIFERADWNLAYEKIYGFTHNVLGSHSYVTYTEVEEAV